MPSLKKVMIPLHVDDLIGKLKELSNQLQSGHTDLLHEKNYFSPYFSQKKYHERARKLAKQDLHIDEVLSDLKMQSEHFKNKADEIEAPFLKYKALFDRQEYIKKNYFEAMSAAACDYIAYVESVLRKEKDKKAAADALLIPAMLFSDSAAMRFDEKKEILNISLSPSVSDDSFSYFISSFNTQIKNVWDKQSVTAYVWTDRHFAKALDIIGEQLDAVIKKEEKQLKGKIIFNKKNFYSSIQFSEDALALEKEAGLALDEVAETEKKYKADTRYFVEEKSSAKELLSEKKEVQSYLVEASHELAKESENDHNLLRREVDMIEKVWMDASAELKSTTENLKEQLTQESKERQAAVQNFDTIYSSVLAYNMTDKINLVATKIATLEERYEASCTAQDKKLHSKKLEDAKKVVESTLFFARTFKNENKEILTRVRQEKWQQEILSSMRQAIFQNLPFWERQVFIRSQYKIGAHQVPNGISSTARILDSRGTELQKIENIIDFCQERLSACKKCLFFSTRSDATTAFYQAVAAIRYPRSLTEESVVAFKNSLAKIQDKRGKLDFSSLAPSPEISSLSLSM